jgi:hypothetical protein
MPGQYFRGAFIEFTSSFLVPIPNVIVFQYNPETLSHTWSPAASAAPSGASQGPGQGNPLAVSGDPGEEFSFTLMMDSGDIIADGIAPAAALANASGLYPMLAALELLLFPSTSTGSGAIAGALSTGAGAVAGGGAAGALSTGVGAAAAALGGGSGGVQRSVPLSVVPTVLFVWGPGRILPVRVSSLRITEKLYDPTLLVPTHAEAEIGLRVLTQLEIDALDDGLVKQLVQTAYSYMGTLRQGLALANLVNSTNSIVGMLPF